MEEEKKKRARKFNITGGMPAAYKLYKEKHGKKAVGNKVYSNVCTLFNRKLSDKIIRESLEVRLFFRMGFLRIRATKLKVCLKDGKIDSNKTPIDWIRTLDLWEKTYGTRDRSKLKEIKNKKLVYHVNENTNGFIMMWYWDKRGCNVKNNRLYKFSPVKGGVSPDGYYYGRRGLAKWINNEERINEYYL